jgi:hypothetical protein
VAEIKVKRLLCCGFVRTDKTMGQVYQCWWKICREINGCFPGSNIACVAFYTYLCDLFTLPRKLNKVKKAISA